MDSLQDCIKTINAIDSEVLPEENLINSVSSLYTAITYDANLLRYAAGNLNYDALFKLLSTSFITDNVKSGAESHRIIQQCCSIFEKIMGTHGPDYIFQNFIFKIISVPPDAAEDFQVALLKQVFRMTEKEYYAQLLVSSQSAINYVFRQLGSTYVSVAAASSKILKGLYDYGGELAWLFSNDIKEICREIYAMDVKGIARFRVLEIFVDLVHRFPVYLERCVQLEVFSKLLEEIHSDDILAQLNAMEMIVKIATCSEEGLMFVRKNGVMEFVLKLVNSPDDGMASFLLPGALKFYGHVAHKYPLDLLSNYSLVTDFVLDNVSSPDPTLRILCAETIAHVVSSEVGLKYLYKNSEKKLKNAVRIMSKIGANPSEDMSIRQRIFESLSKLMFVSVAEDLEVSQICHSLYLEIGSNPMTYIYDIIKHPFPELRNAAYHLLSRLSRFQWAEQDMALCPGLIEFLLDRKTENEREGRELKYLIIKTLSDSGTSSQNLGVDAHGKILLYAKQGPFYRESEVAVEYNQED